MHAPVGTEVPICAGKNMYYVIHYPYVQQHHQRTVGPTLNQVQCLSVSAPAFKKTQVHDVHNQ